MARRARAEYSLLVFFGDYFGTTSPYEDLSKRHLRLSSLLSPLIGNEPILYPRANISHPNKSYPRHGHVD
eukprot:scaffold184_cov125-Cylindrotheca_fusiformis.AAC.16